MHYNYQLIYVNPLKLPTIGIRTSTILLIKDKCKEHSGIFWQKSSIVICESII